MVRRIATTAVVVSMIGAATACGSDSSGGPEPTDTGTTMATTMGTATATTSAPATDDAAGFTGFIEALNGTDGTVTYQVELPQLRGGDTAVREQFNTRMRAALDDYLEPSEDNTPVTIGPGILDEDDRSEVSHIGAGAVAGVLLLNIYVDGAAHPFNTVSTTVIDARTAEPITITDLFTDETTGLTTLVNGIMAEIDDEEKLAGQSAPEPVADQLGTWVPDDDGLVIYIPVAHVLGDYYPVTVGWDDIDDVLAPGMRETLTS